MITYCNSKDINIQNVKDFYCEYATWKVPNKYEDWEIIIQKSSCVITCWCEKELIGMARALSDEIRWATIIDVLVHPKYRSRFIGTQMIEKLLSQQEMQVRTIYLATADKEKFYSKFGFKIANENCSYMIKVQNIRDGDYIRPVED